MGPSGSGKSTLLQCAAGLDQPDHRSPSCSTASSLHGLNEVALTKLRREQMGFVFQAYNLLPSLTVYDNVALPLRLTGSGPGVPTSLNVLEQVGLEDKAKRRPAELSGGQQQRVAIARALITQPAVFFADEPTGALDSSTSRQVLELLRAATDRAGQTVVMVTHDPVAAAYADRVLFLSDGLVAGSLDRGNPAADRRRHERPGALMFFLSRQTVSRHRSLYAGSFVALAVGVFLLGLAATATAATIAYDAPPAESDRRQPPRRRSADPADRVLLSTGEDVSGLQVVLSMVGAISGFITIFVIASTFAFAVASRRREIGLLRLIGATPRADHAG